MTTEPLVIRVRSPGTPQRIKVKVPAGPQAVRVRVPGPQGPRGLLGGSYYVHQQVEASALWTINHNLGAEPLVAVRTVGGVEVEAAIVHISLNQAQVILATPMAGTARCI